ncbi:hypothetical protein FACS1894137_13450 [Spirochaetia bacterium]|nr:hypothetical protein FACS1894137_13450 [Spirochaetia bacterium]
MPWRLIGLVLVFIIFLAFTGFNLNNRCDISFVFWTAKELPVFLPIFASFVLGLLCSIPFAISIDRKRAKKDGKDIDTPTQPKKKWGKGDSPQGGGGPEDLSAGGPYGID